MNIYQKLNEARKLFHQKQMQKSGHNKFAGYDYFTIADFISPALEIFEEVGLVGMVSFGKELATLEIVNCDQIDERIQFTSPMSEANLKGCHPVQNLGAVHTYLRRYLWVAALEIVEQDALDSAPKLPVKGDISNTAKKIPAKAGIGDDLPMEKKDSLLDLAAEVTELVQQDNAEHALNVIRAFGLEGDENIWLDRQLPSQIRSALRKVSQQPKAV